MFMDDIRHCYNKLDTVKNCINLIRVQQCLVPRYCVPTVSLLFEIEIISWSQERFT